MEYDLSKREATRHAMDISLEEAIQRGGGPIRRGDKGKGSARPSPYGKGGGRGGSKGGGSAKGFGGGGKGKGGGKSVYVGNLTWTVSWQDLKDHFKTIGPVLNADVMQEPDGRSKGCGLVTFANARDADRAIRELHDTDINGRNIFVREDRDAPGGGKGGGGGGKGGGGKSVYVGNLTWTVAWQDLKDHFKTIGPVLNADIMMEEDGRSKGCGLVTFQNARDADRAINELHDTEINGRNIFVREDREAPGGGGGGKGGGGGGGSSSTVYVGNLSYHTAWQDLKDLCKEVGTVLHADVMMEEDGRSKGCGLVKFATAREASRAIAELHDAELDGRKIFVREDRETAGGAGCKLYVGNLSPGTTWMDLKDLFREAVRAYLRARTCACACACTCTCTCSSGTSTRTSTSTSTSTSTRG